MALTKIPIELSSTPSIVDGGNATAITIDSNEGVAFSKDISTSTAGTSNFRAGVNAGNSIASGGNYNVVVGDEAGTAITTGDDNVAIGYTAGDSLTTGSSNVIVGSLAGDSLTTGNYNVAMGRSALGADTLGSSTVAIGFGALDAQNFTSATDSYNTAVGRSAGGAVTTGVNNTIIGGLAGDALTTGESNVAVGISALSADTKGTNNVAVGRGALETQNFTSATASLNVAVGSLAGNAVTTGINNTLIGGLAGDALTTGTNNTVIGNASAAGSVSAANRIVLGWTTVGTGNAHFTFGQGAGSDRVYNSFQSNASWTRVSDQRYKEEVVNNTDCGLSFINALRPVTFKFKALSNIDSSLPDYDEDATSRNYDNKMYGLIAQEVKQAMDDNNITDFGGWDVDEASGIQAISQEMFVHPLIKAVQDLSAQLDAALARIETLEGA